MSDRSPLRATLVADLDDQQPWLGRPCDDCGVPVRPRSSWVVDRGDDGPLALLCDDCTAAAWRAAASSGPEADVSDTSRPPWLRVVR